MKNLISGLILLSTCLPIQLTRAQSGQQGFSGEGKLLRYSYNEQNFATNVPLNEVSSRAIRYFLKNFPEVKNEVWIRTESGFTAFFLDQNETIKLFFNSKGYFTYTEKSYGATDLNPDVNSLVSNRYPAYHIVQVHEINDGTQYLYEVQISNSERTRMLTVRNKDIETSTEYIN